MDFEVQEVAGREEALDMVRDIGDFDVAILDMCWRPNGNGASISGTETIREMHRASPVLGIVAHGDRPERHLANAALGAGASPTSPAPRAPSSCARRSALPPRRSASSTAPCRRKAAAA